MPKAKTVNIYPFHESRKWVYAWVVRIDEDKRPVLHTLRLKRIRNRRIIFIVRKEDENA
jgi:hypothetical protein